MAGHKTTIVPAGEFQWMGRCSCRMTGKIGTHPEALMWVANHEQVVARVNLHARTRHPSLKDQYDYFRERSLDTAVPEHDRALWTQLADELYRRLHDDEGVEQPPLFAETEQ